MDWSILLDCFYNLNDISFSLEDHRDELVEKDIIELKSLLKDEDKRKVDIFACGITNYCDLVAYEYFEKAIHFGVCCGMEIQKALHDYFEE